MMPETNPANDHSPSISTVVDADKPKKALDARLHIAKQYCRVLTAIDDEIFQKSLYQADPKDLRIADNFNTLRESCEDNEIFCHLMHFPESDHSTDRFNTETQKYLKRAVKSAQGADVVVLDWHLAHSTDPTNALYILDKLTQGKPKVQFVMIYTSQKQLKDVANQINADFQKRDLYLEDLYPPVLPTPSSVEDDDALVSGASSVADAEEATDVEERFGFHLDSRLFLFLVTKDQIKAEELLKFIHEALAKLLPDRLQWAGLELMTRARDILPKVVAALPPGTNAALQGQILFQHEDEVAFQVADSLLDELRHALIEKPLEVVSDEELFGDICSQMKALLNDTAKWKTVAERVAPGIAVNIENIRRKKETGRQISVDDEAKLEKFERFRLQWDDNDLPTLRGDIGRGQSHVAKHYFPQNTKKDLALCIAHFLEVEQEEAEIIQRHAAWAQVRESVLITQGIKLRPGAVLRRIAAESHPNAPEWLFCQTGACDCYAPHGHGFLFIKGRTEDGAVESKPSETQACVLGHEIIWDAPRMLVLPDPTKERVFIPNIPSVESEKNTKENESEAQEPEKQEPEKSARYKIVGALRTEFTARIIQRVFNHQGRIGVDTCELIRVRRGE